MTTDRLATGEFEALLESAPDGIVVVDDGGRIVLVNRRLESLFGYRRADLLGRSLEMLFPEEASAAVAQRRVRVAAERDDEEPGAGLELDGRRQDGTEFPVELSFSPIEDRTSSHVTVFVRDVSERRALEHERLELARAEAARDEAQAAAQWTASLLADIDAIVWEADGPERHRFTFASQRAEGMLGYPLRRWTDDDGFWASIVHPDDLDLVTSFFLGSAAHGRDHELEYRVLAADDRVVWVRDLVRIVDTGDGHRHLRGVMIDVTERRELQTLLLHSQKLDAVGQLAGGIAHDFNNLLTVISGHASLLEGQVGSDAGEESVEEIRAAAGRAAELTQQLLAFSRRAPAAPELVDLGDLVHGVQGMLARLIGEDVELVVDATPRLHFVRADRGQLEQVLVNLVVNARDAMPGGGRIVVTVSAATRARSPAPDPNGGWAVLSVCDTGTGMSPETRARIFEPFFTTKEPGKGTGLGLATVYGIVEQAGGRIEVSSEPGRGSCFELQLPRVPAARAPDDGLGSRGTILLVEDEAALRRLARSILEEERFHVLEAGNGLEALAVAEQHPEEIDLLLTDVVMPEIGGPELVARVSELRPELPVVYMSGYTDSRLAEESIEDFSEHMLLKPFSPLELLRRVERELSPDA